MIPANSHFIIFSVLLAAALFGMAGERKHWFKSISGVLVTILLMAVLASIGLVPSASDSENPVPVYDFIFTYFVPLSIPLLLFDVQLSKIIRESGRLLILFLLGSLGVVLGAVIAYFLLPLGADGHKLAGVFIGTYTGGSVNFIGVASSLDFLDNPLFSSAVAVDNVLTNFYLMFLFVLPGIKMMSRYFLPPSAELMGEKIPEKESLAIDRSLMEQVTLALLISFIVCAAGFVLGPILAKWIGTEIKLEILLITLLITILANVVPQLLQKLSHIAFELGMFLLYIFLAVIGAASDLGQMFTAAPVIIFFALIILIIHFAWTMMWGKLLNFSLEEISLASAANTGGPAIAAPLAATLNMPKAVTPAILVGVMGYVIGTILGVSVGLWLS